MRPIDADFLRGLVNEKLEEDCGFLPRKFLFGVRDLLDSTPTINAVEVVRCRDCKEFEKKRHPVFAGYCKEFDSYMADDDFCSYGERKNNV